MLRKKKSTDHEEIAKNDLSRFSVFAGLTPEQLQKIERLVREKQVPAGEEITREGEKGDELFLLLKGKVEVSKTLTLMVGRGDVDTRDKSLIQLDAAKSPMFGEMAILREDSIRSATVKALEACTIGIIKRKDLLELCEQDKEIGFRILSNIARQLAENLEKANRDILKLTTAFSLALQN